MVEIFVVGIGVVVVFLGLESYTYSYLLINKYLLVFCPLRILMDFIIMEDRENLIILFIDDM